MSSVLGRQLKAAVFGAVPRLVQRGSTSRRRVAITFDDGPDELTLQYLDLLDRLKVRATFFLCGQNCNRHPDLVREYVRRGHQLGNHGYDHKAFTILSMRELTEQLERSENAIGPQPTARHWVRPPYGNMNARVLGQLVARGDVIALWSLDSFDYRCREPAEVIANCSVEKVQPGDVLLFHEGQKWTLEAIPSVVENLRGAGFELTTMAELLEE